MTVQRVAVERRLRQAVAPAFVYGDRFLDEAISVWQPRYPNRKLSAEDAREIISNVAGFLQVLREWDQRDRGQEQPISDYARPLIGLEPKRRIISTSRSFPQIFEMRNLCRSDGENWRIW
jgi:hypothetical protein